MPRREYTILFALLASAGVAFAGDLSAPASASYAASDQRLRSYYDYADILAVQPVRARPRGPLECDDSRSGRSVGVDGLLPAPPLHLGSVRQETPSIAAAIVREVEVLAAQARDRGPTAAEVCQQPPARITGYEVVYEYGGRTYRRIMQAPPSGDQLRVRVEHAATDR